VLLRNIRPMTDPEPQLTRESAHLPSHVAAGVAVIEQALATMPLTPGVYRMLNQQGDALYVGKARALKKRVTSYTQVNRLPERLRRMVAQTASMEIITTHTEAEALLLEANLIKRLNPRYNILLKDDKSYPWLVLTEDHDFPQVSKHRGAQTQKAAYFGPFASGWAVNQTVNLMQRIFLLRSCTDHVFAQRTRPCLLFQIKRCSAPCVGKISKQDYAGLIAQAKEFLTGRASTIQREMAAQMQEASDSLEFETAAVLRDRISALTTVQTSSVINPASIENADVIAIHQIAGQTCAQVFFIRGGCNNGNRALFPLHAKDAEAAEVISALIAQFYDDKPPPPLLLVSHIPADHEILAAALTLKANRKVTIARPERGEKFAVLAHALTNAREALERKLAENAGQAKLLEAVGNIFNLAAPPNRIEIYDNSHISGQSPYGVMVVAGPEGFRKAAYRKYSIKGAITPGDDFAMMREMLTRRFVRAIEEGKQDSIEWPDLLLIDGGAGQVSAVQGVLTELGVTDVPLVGIAKGPDRDAGREWFFQPPREAFQLPPRDGVLYYLQRLRDEAHRFAIGTHRAARSKKLVTSELDEIPGIGPARKKALLHHFGSARGVKQAGLAELSAAPGISKEIAQRVYEFYHQG